MTVTESLPGHASPASTQMPGHTEMQVRKRNGDTEPVDVNKIVRAVGRSRCTWHFAFDVVDVVRGEEPGLFDEAMVEQVREMLAEAVECEAQFAADLLGLGVPGMSPADMRGYLQHLRTAGSRS
jgi:ribonucleotide reductase beta subunit family protein with ferritin-like domain